jgi:hypothetical protein
MFKIRDHHERSFQRICDVDVSWYETGGPPSIDSQWGLEAGDHLTRAEFEQRYARQPDVKKAELIEGVVYMPSPVHLRKHATPHRTWPSG